MISNYIICATPRSGSNLLCELLSSLGYAGAPYEHLWDPPGSDLEPLSTRWPRVLEAGKDKSGVFGTKLMYYQAHRLEDELPDIAGAQGGSLGDLLSVLLASPKYIYLTRRDHLRQAISLTRAVESGRWRSVDGAAQAPHYNPKKIWREIAFLEEDETNWEAFFVRNSVSPCRISYEGLDTEPLATVSKILTFLGGDPPGLSRLAATRHRRQADSETEEWVRRCQREQPAE